MIRSLKVLLLLLTFLGVGLRVTDLHSVLHEISHHVCEHDHDHDDNTPAPCNDPHHHCTCLQPIFGLPEMADLKLASLQMTPASLTAAGNWHMPDDPVYALEIPPIIS